MTPVVPSTPEQNDRYRRGVCSACGEKPPSAGRPRCEECHQEYRRSNSFEPQLTRQPAPEKKRNKQ